MKTKSYSPVKAVQISPAMLLPEQSQFTSSPIPHPIDLSAASFERRTQVVAGITVTGRQLSIVAGHLPEQEVQAIVNQINFGDFHDQTEKNEIVGAAGDKIMRRLRTRCPDGCSAGRGVVTGAGRLAFPICRIVHVAAPVWRGGRYGEVSQLEETYRTALALAESIGLSSIAFPALSMGILQGAFPIDLAADAAVSTILGYLRQSHGMRYVAIVPGTDSKSSLIAAFCRSLSFGAGSISQGA